MFGVRKAHLSLSRSFFIIHSFIKYTSILSYLPYKPLLLIRSVLHALYQVLVALLVENKLVAKDQHTAGLVRSSYGRAPHPPTRGMQELLRRLRRNLSRSVLFLSVPFIHVTSAPIPLNRPLDSSKHENGLGTSAAPCTYRVHFDSPPLKLVQTTLQSYCVFSQDFVASVCDELAESAQIVQEHEPAAQARQLQARRHFGEDGGW